MTDDDVKEARARATALRNSLPQSVNVAALGVWEKAPFQLLCTREALIWRTEELARTACDALERLASFRAARAEGSIPDLTTSKPVGDGPQQIYEATRARAAARAQACGDRATYCAAYDPHNMPGR